MFYFVNIITGWCSTPVLTISEYSSKETFVDALSTSLLLHNSVALLYRDRILHSHIIIPGRWHITNWYCNSFSCHLCTTWGKFASDSKKIFSPLQSDSTMNSDPHNYFLNFTIAQLTVAASPTKTCLDFSSGNNVDLEMKKNWLKKHSLQGIVKFTLYDVLSLCLRFYFLRW